MRCTPRYLCSCPITLCGTIERTLQNKTHKGTENCISQWEYLKSYKIIENSRSVKGTEICFMRLKAE